MDNTGLWGSYIQGFFRKYLYKVLVALCFLIDLYAVLGTLLVEKKSENALKQFLEQNCINYSRTN